MAHKFYELTFTPSVKAAQQQYGSRRHYAKYESGESDFAGLGEDEREFISQRDGFYLATVGENLQPYIQFRGGKRGFLKLLDAETLAFADFRGNLQYISVGNLKQNDKAALFLMDYANRQRLKILARVEVKDAKEAPKLTAQVTMPGDKSVIERVMMLHVEAYDWNCPQHITQRFTAEEIEEAITPLYERIEKLEAENRQLRQQLQSQKLTAGK
jgi:predicted pyridoxine 5'-phosphate oxidase superfamily flavin-nucleotide-binding protein